MGLGDEIMALGRAEALFEETGKAVAITRPGGYARVHDAWRDNPAWDSRWHDGRVVPYRCQQIVDGAALRPYIKQWVGRRIIYNMDYRARAGRIHLGVGKRQFAYEHTPDYFAVIAPHIKKNASPNKLWPQKNWEAAIEGIPFPVLQLVSDDKEEIIKGAVALRTPTFHHAAAVIERSQFVLCNEGGTHHMAASMKRPAVVIFGSFVPPCVTGYDFHINISVENEHAFCGSFDHCRPCQDALAQIPPDVVRSAISKLLAGASNG